MPFRGRRPCGTQFSLRVVGPLTADRTEKNRRARFSAQDIDPRVGLTHIHQSTGFDLESSKSIPICPQRVVTVYARIQVAEMCRRNVPARDRFHLKYVDNL